MFIPIALEELERRSRHDLWQAADSEVAAENRIDLASFGPVQATIVPEEPTEPSLNLILGAAAPDAVETGHLANAVGWAGSHGVDYRIPVTPGRPGARAAEEWLIEWGHEQGSSRTKLVRDVSLLDLPRPLGIEAINRASLPHDEGFPNALATGLGMPEWADTFFFDLPETEGWHCYVAAEGDYPLAYVAMLIHAGLAELVLVPNSHWSPKRVPDALMVLLGRCIEDAAAAGCAAIFAEVEEPRRGRPLAVHHESLLLVGFEQAFVRAEWRPPRHAVEQKRLTISA